MNKSSSKAPASAKTGKPDKSKKAASKPEESVSDNPADTEGGVRSPLDGKFEADHRPSR